jgi:hypothetical protein
VSSISRKTSNDGLNASIGVTNLQILHALWKAIALIENWQTDQSASAILANNERAILRAK